MSEQQGWDKGKTGIAGCAAQPEPDLPSGYRFQHKNPEDPAEVPGGFLSDLNPVGLWGVGESGRPP